jgi:YD repeat-containing protein
MLVVCLSGSVQGRMDHYDVSALGARVNDSAPVEFAGRQKAARSPFRRSWIWLTVLLGALLISTSYATTYYTYDVLGRVTQVVESDGTTTQYAYDANGNVTSITRTAGTSVLSIGSVSTSSGAVGSSITINGSGFSSISSQDIVTIDGVAAQVTYASDNRLVITVPAGATTGNVAITTQNGSITSSNPFTVVPVSVTSFSPANGTVGTVVTINGGGFDPTPANNTVLINGMAATVSSATPTQLQVTVPSGATPGHISVTAPLGSANSAADFFVPASGYTMSQIVQVNTLVSGGDGYVSSINGANQVAVALFDGTVGQRMSVAATNVVPYGHYAVFSPDGSTLASDTVSNSTAVSLPTLPATGTYAWYYTPSSIPASATFTLQTDMVGGLPVDGTPTTVALVPGQNATYTFSGTAGQTYNLTLYPFTSTNNGYVQATILKPDGTVQVNCGYYEPYYSDTQDCDFTLNATGTYSVHIVSATAQLSTFSFNLLVIQDFSAILTPGTPGAAVGVSLVPDQHGIMQFSATANQTLALYVGNTTLTPNHGQAPFTVTGPNPSTTGLGQSYLSSGQTTTFNLPNLTAGTYSVSVGSSYNGVAVAAQAILANGVTATLPVNGTSAQLQTYLPGQAAYFTFAATAGQSLGLGLTQLALTPGTVGDATISVYKPDKGYLTSATCYVGSTPGCQVSLTGLPETGNYQVVVSPGGQATMALALTLSQDIGGTLTVGTATNVNLTSTGQNGLFTFTLSGSEAVILTEASLSTSPANTPVTIYVYDANGNLLQYSSSETLNLGFLAAGTYSVLIVPNNAATGSLQITVQPGTSGTLTPDGSSLNFSTVAPGENANLTFSGTAGQNLAIALTNLVLSSGSQNYVTGQIYNPDGSSLSQTNCYSGSYSCDLEGLELPQTGTYSVRIVPSSTQTMSFTTTTSAAVTGTLSLNTSTTVNLNTVGQIGVLSFTATAGQPVVLNVSGVTTTPSGNGIELAVVNSARGYVTWTGNAVTENTFNLNLATGTYQLLMYPSSAYSSGMQVALSTAITGPLTPDGSSTNFATVVPSQVAALTLSGTAGQNLSIALTNLVLSPPGPQGSVSAAILKPDGSTLATANCSVGISSCELAQYNLPQTGTYTLQVTPNPAQTMSFTTTTSTAVTGALSPNTPMTLNLSTVGQFAMLSFTVTAGQPVVLNVSGVTTTPSGNGINVTVFNSAWSSVDWTGAASTSISLNLGDRPTGTYQAFIYPSGAYSSSMQVSVQE